jgi:hypothetical protein
MQSYILDNSSTAEYQRFDLMSKILDPRIAQIRKSVVLPVSPADLQRLSATAASS